MLDDQKPEETRKGWCCYKPDKIDKAHAIYVPMSLPLVQSVAEKCLTGFNVKYLYGVWNHESVTNIQKSQFCV